MTEPNPLPTAGAPIGCYKLIRQAAQGPFGPLCELRAEAEIKGQRGLGRLVAVPADLTPEMVQGITEAVWDCLEIRHEYALCVADLVFGAGWVALIHDYSEGLVLRSLQRRCQEKQSAFPLGVALRVVLDMLDGLDANQDVCASSAISWAPGGASASSLYLCGNGRTRSLDGQLMATLLRTGPVREQASAVGFPAPELLSVGQEPDERTDVFCAGTVLWELLTGRELSLGSAILHGQRPRLGVAKLDVAVPKGPYPVPFGVMQAVHSALELDPANRIATRSAFRSAITANAEVATHAQVIEFTDILLHRESTHLHLNLESGPKLSDEKRGVRPKTLQLEWAIEWAKQVRAKSAREPGMVSRAPPKPRLSQSAPSRSGTTKSLNPRPALALSSSASKLDKPWAKRTLVGMSPVPFAAPSPSNVSNGARHAITEGVEPPSLAADGAETSRAEESLGQHTLVGLYPEPSLGRTSPTRAAPEARPAEEQPAAVPAPSNRVVSICQPEALETSSTTSTAHPLLHAELVEVPSAVTEPSPILPDELSPPRVEPLIEPTRPNAVTLLGVHQAPATLKMKRKFQLSLTTIILGLCGAIGVTALSTTLLFTCGSKTCTDSATPTTQVPIAAATQAAEPSASIPAAPVSTTEPAAAEPSASVALSPEKTVATTAPTASSQPQPETLTSPQRSPAASKAKATVNPSPAVPKNAGRAQPRPYVPHGL